MNKISFDVNNGRKLVLLQEEHDSPVHTYTEDSNGVIEQTGKIRVKDFVMLMNLYTHIMETNEYNIYINPTGIKYK